jgi:hypothetical protein
MTPFDRRVDRRGFLALLAATGTLAIGGRVLSAWGTPAAPPSLVWRLDSHWGYPTGPSQKTHCQCNACVRHARNKVFATRAEAEAGRAHANCVCQPRAVQIDATKFNTLFPSGSGSVDLRTSGVTATYQSALADPRAG